MSFLTNILAGEPLSDLERSVDRAFLNYGISSAVGRFFDPNRRRNELEERLLEQSLTSDSLEEKLKTGVKWASAIRGPGKATLAKLLAL